MNVLVLVPREVISTGSSDQVMGIDAWSSSVRCSLHDGTDRLVDTKTSFGYGFVTTRDGGATLDADAFCGLVFRTIDETLARAGAREISRVALSTFWHGLLGVDRRSNPTTPVFTWTDQQAAGVAEELRGRLD